MLHRTHVSRFVPFVVLTALVLTGCPKLTKSDGDAASSASPAVTTAPSAAASDAPATTTAGGVPSFLKVAPLPAGPIAVTGYPHEIRNGMNDPADTAGFSTKDGSVFGYCAHGGGIESTRCEFVDRAGKVTKMSSTEGEGTPAEKAKKKAIDDFLKANPLPKIKLDAGGGDPSKVKGPAFAGTWTFTDITLDVARIDAKGDPGDSPKKGSSAHVKVGGLVKGETQPVHPITLVSPNADKVPPHFAVMNSLSSSPDKSEIGMVATFFGGEFSDAFAMKRITANALASLIYNDTGFLRHHQKNEFAKSAALFEKAVAADPSAKTPAYNLACAWARLKDPRAKDALAYAIERDPGAKKRATTDKDFDGVKTEAWFTTLTK